MKGSATRSGAWLAWRITISVLLLAGPALLAGVTLYREDPAGYEGSGGRAWVIEGEVLSIGPVEGAPSGHVRQKADVRVTGIVAEARGDTPNGTIEVVLPHYASASNVVQPGRAMRLAVTGYELHNPEDGVVYFRGFHLEDVRTGCCWESRIDQARWMLPLVISGAITIAVLWVDGRVPASRRERVGVGFALAAGACMGLIGAGLGAGDSWFGMAASGPTLADALALPAIAAAITAFIVGRQGPMTPAVTVAAALVYPWAGLWFGSDGWLLLILLPLAFMALLVSGRSGWRRTAAKVVSFPLAAVPLLLLVGFALALLDGEGGFDHVGAGVAIAVCAVGFPLLDARRAWKQPGRATSGQHAGR